MKTKRSRVRPQAWAPFKKFKTFYSSVHSSIASTAFMLEKNRRKNKISLRWIEEVFFSLQALLASLSSAELNDSATSDSVEDFSDLWHTKPFSESQFWFFKADETVEAVEVVPDSQSLATQDHIMSGDEQAIVSINNLVIKVQIFFNGPFQASFWLFLSVLNFANSWLN